MVLFLLFSVKPSVFASWLELWSYKQLTLLLKQTGNRQLRAGLVGNGIQFLHVGGKGTNLFKLYRKSDKCVKVIIIYNQFSFRVYLSGRLDLAVFFPPRWPIPMTVASSLRAAALEIKMETELNLFATVSDTRCRMKSRVLGRLTPTAAPTELAQCPLGRWPALRNPPAQKGRLHQKLLSRNCI